MKKVILMLVMLIGLTACTSETSLDEILSNTVFDTTESCTLFTMSSMGALNSSLEFEYTISESNNYIKLVKNINGDKETNIIYTLSDTYYLYQDKNDVISVVELDESYALELFEKYVSDRDDLYTNINTNATSYTISTSGTTDTVTYTELINNINYDTQFKYNNINNKFIGLQKTFTKDNSIYSTNLTISYTIDTTIPGGNK